MFSPRYLLDCKSRARMGALCPVFVKTELLSTLILDDRLYFLWKHLGRNQSRSFSTRKLVKHYFWHQRKLVSIAFRSGPLLSAKEAVCCGTGASAFSHGLRNWNPILTSVNMGFRNFRNWSCHHGLRWLRIGSELKTSARTHRFRVRVV